jgi:hypothetical protein
MGRQAYRNVVNRPFRKRPLGSPRRTGIVYMKVDINLLKPSGNFTYDQV